MIHGVHRFQIYTKRVHKLFALLLTLLPFGLILVFGTVGDLDMRTLLLSLAISFYRLLVGYLISLVLGVTIALVLGMSKWGEHFVPILDVMQNVPSFALIPIFVLAFGYTDTMAILFIATAVIWPILFYCLSAIRTARADWDEAAKIFGAKGWKRVWYYLLPVSSPAIITGSIVGLSIGWEAVIGLEIIGLSSGIGIVLTQATTAHNNAMLLAGIGLLLALVFVLNRLLWSPLLKHTHYYAE